MNRGDVYWVNLNPTKGSEINKERPCVLVGATPINQARRTVVVVPLSTKAIVKPPITVAVHCLGKTVAAVCDQIRTIDKTRIKKQAGALSHHDIQIVDAALKEVLALE
ncbi:MAG: PemK-like protein [uncultured bacterium]|nr:MAG: PemK-like protein [uncultured bacterium]OGT34159.1 MAG: PemK family transcriptional regulator [Gammaproteobacteria bacterium RIFCSPHIGHO2_02_FULL_39_13]OGT50056.1 MAG: PemK family transcriptional regulator [Gammaproteobacteria bacterium RIFCSPHIGHO2_12_FULL_39_24]